MKNANKNQIRDMFLQQDEAEPLDEKRKAEMFEILKRSAVNRETERKKPYNLIIGLDLIRSQLKYMDKKVSLAQFLFAMGLLALYLYSYQRVDSRSLIEISAVVASVVGLFPVLSCTAAGDTGMMELAASCYFGTRQICIFRMILGGSLDLLLLGAAILFHETAGGLGLAEAGLYLLLPFILSCCVYFGTVLTKAGREHASVLVVCGAFVAVVTGIAVSNPAIYEKTAAAVWAFILVLGALVLILEIVCLFGKIEKGDILCMN